MREMILEASATMPGDPVSCLMVSFGGGGGGGGGIRGRAGEDGLGGGIRSCASGGERELDGTDEPEEIVESSAMMPDDSMQGSVPHRVGRFGIVIRLEICKASSSVDTRAHSRSSTSENLATAAAASAPRF